MNERTDFVTTFQLAEKEIDRGSATAELAWIGHKAEQWHDHMASHRSKVRERYDAVLEEVGRRINSMPDKVTPEQAMAMSRNRRMP
ncbi:hypothetical protein [Streptomyces sp. NPDC088923]|uniref:hypothetical protein n=1 Tax=Streptomyces sp. NPDC088923 TaxID=3365913 RepID=UPI0037F62614